MSHRARYDQSRTHKVWGHGFIPSPTYHVFVANTSGMVTCYYGLLLYLHKEHMSWHDHGNNSYVFSFPKWKPHLNPTKATSKLVLFLSSLLNRINPLHTPQAPKNNMSHLHSLSKHWRWSLMWCEWADLSLATYLYIMAPSSLVHMCATKLSTNIQIMPQWSSQHHVPDNMSKDIYINSQL